MGGFLATFPYIVYNKGRKTCSFFMGRVQKRKGNKMDLNLNLMQMVNSLARWVFVALAVYILARCILSLIRAKNPAEVWAYMHMVTYASDRDGYVSPAE